MYTMYILYYTSPLYSTVYRRRGESYYVREGASLVLKKLGKVTSNCSFFHVSTLVAGEL